MSSSPKIILSIPIIATLIISAAVPCIGALIATRSAALRRIPLLDLISGKYKRLPKSVST